MLELINICDVTVDGINHRDYPDYCDAYISDAWVQIDSTEYETTHLPVERKGDKYFRQLSEKELDWLNEHREFVYTFVEKHIY